jgi:glycosyltransferase involved in cell wall biosynthesis
LQAAFASRLLPSDSIIHITHAGKVLEPQLEAAAKQEQRENRRYEWLGELSHEHALLLLARSRLLVISSTMEGGANAIAEAVVCGVPVLCSDISGNIGMLGRDYPGYFQLGNTQQLAGMLYRAETDSAFLGQLHHSVCALQSRFAPDRELACWNELVDLLFFDITPGGNA